MKIDTFFLSHRKKGVGMKNHIFGKRGMFTIGISAALLASPFVSAGAQASGFPAATGAIQNKATVGANASSNGMVQPAVGLTTTNGAYVQVKHKGKSAKKDGVQK